LIQTRGCSSKESGRALTTNELRKLNRGES
jgi:hypothetical protein